MTVLDCPEVIPCGLQDVKIQLPSRSSLGDPVRLRTSCLFPTLKRAWLPKVFFDTESLVWYSSSFCSKLMKCCRRGRGHPKQQRRGALAGNGYPLLRQGNIWQERPMVRLAVLPEKLHHPQCHHQCRGRASDSGQHQRVHLHQHLQDLQPERTTRLGGSCQLWRLHGHESRHQQQFPKRYRTLQSQNHLVWKLGLKKS